MSSYSCGKQLMRPNRIYFLSHFSLSNIVSIPRLDDVLGCWPISAKDVVVATEGSLRTRLPLAMEPVAVTRVPHSSPAFARMRA